MIDKATNTIPQMKNMFSVLALLVRCTSVEGEETEFCEDQPPNRLPHVISSFSFSSFSFSLIESF